MQFLLLVYTEEELQDKLPAQEFDIEMKQCLPHAVDRWTRKGYNHRLHAREVGARHCWRAAACRPCQRAAIRNAN